MAALRKINKLSICFIFIITLSPNLCSRAFGQTEPQLLDNGNGVRHKVPSHRNEGNLEGDSKYNIQSPFNQKAGGIADPAGEEYKSPKKQSLIGMKLAQHPDCVEDVQRYCPVITGGNMMVLQCMQNLPEVESISPGCQNLLWLYKKKLTMDLSFEGAGKDLCRNTLAEFPECAGLDGGKGLVLSCLILNMQNITEHACVRFLSKMQPIVFSDYQLIYKFADACSVDIENLKCGRIVGQSDKGDKVDNKLPHGEVISCLMEKSDKLQNGCRQEILRVAELQSDDFSKDRALYHACRDEVIRLCDNVNPGKGDMYKCLYRHKNDPSMSVKCHEKLTSRQKLERADYRVNKGFVLACKDDVLKNSCTQPSKLENVGNYREAKLSWVLLCLESARTNGKQITPECLAEMNEIRRSLMSDYQLTPEIVHDCADEISHCNPMSYRPNGRTLHCLMDLARVRQHPDVHRGEVQFTMGQPCRKAMSDLLKEVNIRENVDLDPVIQQACSSVINAKCSDQQTSNGRLMDCLMDYIDQPRVIHRDSVCREKLMEIQYFISRDFTLSARFYRTCHQALTQGPCKYDVTKDLSQSNQSAILLCLYRAGKQNQIDKDCMDEAKRVVIERAKSVDLPADVEESCRDDLANLCSDKEKLGKNVEMDCLEDNLEKIESEDCKKVVERYIEEEEEEPELNEIILDECHNIIDKHCKEARSNENEKEEEELSDSLMQCLIRNKHDPEMNKKCRAQVTHHQIITLKDWHLSKDFKEACRQDVQEHCQVKTLKTKSAVVTCLSELVRNDTLTENKQRVGNRCRKQLKFELLQMSSNIQLDAELQEKCKKDVKLHCSEINPEQSNSEVINCLRANQRNLTHECHAVVFQRELREARDPGTDFLLMSKCKRMITKYCYEGTEEIKTHMEVFSCLVKNKADEDFDPECGKIVTARERTRAQDVRLNPELMRSCMNDINKFCNTHVAEDSATAREGKVLYCLRQVFASQATDSRNHKSDNVRRLSERCYVHVKELVRESVLDYLQDKNLADACKEQIKSQCLESIVADNNEMGDRGEVVECLKKALTEHKIHNITDKDSKCLLEVVRVSMESKTDVQVDPLLYRMCATDIKTSCSDVPPGEGRRMSCLLEVNADPEAQLRPECKKALNDRIQLWELAAQKPAPDTMQDVVAEISRSESRNYLTAVIFSCIGVLFLCGIFCGRVTKRVERQAKIR